MTIWAEERRELEKSLGPVETVADFAAKVAEAAKDTDWAKALLEAAPWWAGAVGHAAGEAVGPVKFCIALAKKLTEVTDPDQLTWLAANLAYIRSLESSLGRLSKRRVTDPLVDIRTLLNAYQPERMAVMSTLTFRFALVHPFVRSQDRMVEAFAARVLGLDAAECRNLLSEVHAQFVTELKDLLVHPDTAERFKTVRDRLELGRSEALAHAWLAAHRDWQRAQFLHEAVLSREPFSLSQVYIETECGFLRWREISGATDDAQRRNPFSETAECGGRQDVMSTVLRLLADREFRDAIVVQGPAGAGKSAFTLALANRLLDEGLRPIRIRLRDMRRFEHDVFESLAECIQVGPPSVSGEDLVPPDDALLGGSVFDEGVSYGGAHISPYVLILDGWDELTIAGADSFKDRLKDLLPAIRDRILRRPGRPQVRVILTGRPTPDLEGARFLLDDTPILTLRAIRPDQLLSYAKQLGSALEGREIVVDRWNAWSLAEPKYAAAVEAYAAWWKLRDELSFPPRQADNALEVLGLPLLALLAFRLMAEWQGDPSSIWQEPTNLYRSLIDLTVGNAGKDPDDPLDGDAVHIRGERLRRLLRRTAAAISIEAFGQESITFDSLAARLREPDLAAKVDTDSGTNTLHALVVAFYFKGGHPGLGCEFLHKSFREYLFAEHIVETLKSWGRGNRNFKRERAAWWADFDSIGTPGLHELSRNVSELFAPQWLTAEVRRHLRALLQWEIERARRGDVRGDRTIGQPTDSMSLDGWEGVRDAVGSLWEWWAEGAHMRPQPTAERYRTVMRSPYAEDLIEWCLPAIAAKGSSLAPPRLTTVDAHLGDGLFELAASLHYHVAIARGWNGKWALEAPADWSRDRRYQRRLGDFVFFRPGDGDPGWVMAFCGRINSAGERSPYPFPSASDCRGVDFSGSRLWGVLFISSDLRNANLQRIVGESVVLFGSDLRDADMRQSMLRNADIEGVRTFGAVLDPEGESIPHRQRSLAIFDALRKASTVEGAQVGIGPDDTYDILSPKGISRGKRKARKLP